MSTGILDGRAPTSLTVIVRRSSPVENTAIQLAYNRISGALPGLRPHEDEEFSSVQQCLEDAKSARDARSPDAKKL